jgi:hypothetical protein
MTMMAAGPLEVSACLLAALSSGYVSFQHGAIAHGSSWHKAKYPNSRYSDVMR